MKTLVIIALMLFCAGCDRGEYIDIGPVLVDTATLPESVAVK